MTSHSFNRTYNIKYVKIITAFGTYLNHFASTSTTLQYAHVNTCPWEKCVAPQYSFVQLGVTDLELVDDNTGAENIIVHADQVRLM